MHDLKHLGLAFLAAQPHTAEGGRHGEQLPKHTTPKVVSARCSMRY
ncbi:hypothetical protein N9K77_00830 [bacterium]|nr:hypothetical protein [bacterium]